MAFIGIVVPVYKLKQTYLSQCVESLINQTFEDIQIILVDDGSPDECGTLCDAYARADVRIKAVHHAKNRGLPAARNTGLEMVDAEWVSFVDGDDWVDLDMGRKLADFLQKQEMKPDIVICSGYRNYPQREAISQPAYESGTWFDTEEKINALQRRALAFVKKEHPPQALALDSACCKLYSVPFLRENNIRFIDVPYREDGLFFLYATQHAERIVYVYETWYHYRSTGNSMVNMYRKNADAEHLRFLEEVRRFADTFDKDEGWMRDLNYAALASMQICITQKFFHRGNPAPYCQRQKDCLTYFLGEPYRSVFRHIDMGCLSRNHKLKAMCIKLRWYAGVSLLRKIYLKIRGKEAYV